MSSGPAPPSSSQSSPPRAFTQGVGTIFQVVGIGLFVVMMFICCASSLLNKDWATHSSLTGIAWHGYTAQRAVSIGLFAAVFFGIALSGIGLGLQAQNRAAPVLGLVLCTIGAAFWLFHLYFAAAIGHSIVFSIICGGLAAVFAALLAFALAAAREMRRNPPPPGHAVLPPGYKIPYSHLHEEPPEVRLAAELEQRRQRLAVQQKELEMLEEKLKRKIEDEKQN